VTTDASSEDDALATLAAHGMLCEILALRAGLRESVRDIARESEVPGLKEAAKRLDLDLIISTERVALHPSGTFERVPSCHPGADRRIVYIGTREGCIRARRHEEDGHIARLGSVLGYPECCIEFYVAQPKRDIPVAIHGRSKRFDIHAHSLLRGITGHGFISNFPCSYACPQAVSLGKTVRKLLCEHDPAFEKDMLRYLASPLLYLGDGREVLLTDGVVKDNEVRDISVALRPAALDLPDFDTVRLDDEEVVFLKEGRAVKWVGKKAGPCILFRFG
jgi:hypothetical protein